jgi:hypothetical protein
MKTKISLSFFFLAITYASFAQTAMPYFTGFDNASQKNGWQMFRKGATGTYQWTYSTFEPYSGTDCLYHDYPVGGTTVTDDWYVSPAFNLSSGGKLDSIRHHFSGFGTPATGDTLAIYMLTGNADPALATSKVLLYDFRGTNYVNDNTWRLTSNITLPSASGSSYIAIRYKTIVNWITVKFDNIRLRSNTTTGISNTETAAEQTKVYPNPANNVINIESQAHIAQINITDIKGRSVLNTTFKKCVDLSDFKTGIYLLTCITSSGERINKTFVKK